MPARTGFVVETDFRAGRRRTHAASAMNGRIGLFGKQARRNTGQRRKSSAARAHRRERRANRQGRPVETTAPAVA
ncbi:hypothetical protein G3O00_38780 [Burkholderia sp. Ac-20384]|uniref:hypothetical protein n=1 Tax=Burkholderia sp. Ac-20384 TaxID=2703902 RepID=UPI001981EC67|nr:hypothetical protein [Burkholderia sp. Ac-20384]MBN3829502.1 hypothetical protein [Burkholderia sp. Ac-20384]